MSNRTLWTATTYTLPKVLTIFLIFFSSFFPGWASFNFHSQLPAVVEGKFILLLSSIPSQSCMGIIVIRATEA